MTFPIFHPSPDPTSNVRKNLVLYPAVLAVCLYVFGLGIVVVFLLPLVMSMSHCLVVLDRYSGYSRT